MDILTSADQITNGDKKEGIRKDVHQEQIWVWERITPDYTLWLPKGINVW